VLSVDDIHARLDDRFRLLTGGNRALPRHQTLQATMEWSHDHLSGAERRMFRRLAVFAGGCTLGAAAQVAGSSADEFETLECLTALHDKSLLMVDRDTAARPRYRMLETVRQYAEDRLNEAGEGSEVRTRHLLHFVALAEEVAETLKGPHPEVAYAILRPGRGEPARCAYLGAARAARRRTRAPADRLGLALLEVHVGGRAWLPSRAGGARPRRRRSRFEAPLQHAAALAKFALVTGRYDVIRRVRRALSRDGATDERPLPDRLRHRDGGDRAPRHGKRGTGDGELFAMLRYRTIDERRSAPGRARCTTSRKSIVEPAVSSRRRHSTAKRSPSVARAMKAKVASGHCFPWGCCSSPRDGRPRHAQPLRRAQ
jgi:hypothetical protein